MLTLVKSRVQFKYVFSMLKCRTLELDNKVRYDYLPHLPPVPTVDRGREGDIPGCGDLAVALLQVDVRFVKQEAVLVKTSERDSMVCSWMSARHCSQVFLSVMSLLSTWLLMFSPKLRDPTMRAATISKFLKIFCFDSSFESLFTSYK